VCLDIDETLVDYVTSARIALTALVGHDDAWPVWRRRTEQHYERYMAGEVDFDTMRWKRTKDFLFDLGESLDDAEAVARERYRQTAMKKAWCLFIDAMPCIERIRAAGFRLGAITNAAAGYQRGKLAAVGLDDVFDHIAISTEIGVAKPDPVIFHTACVGLGVAPHETVHVGDRLDLDAMGARGAGLYGVWLDRGPATDRRADRAPAGRTSVPPDVSVIGGLHELPGLLGLDIPAARR
jgi:putative hydrolase of the HAD superfamily